MELAESYKHYMLNKLIDLVAKNEEPWLGWVGTTSSLMPGWEKAWTNVSYENRTKSKKYINTRVELTTVPATLQFAAAAIFEWDEAIELLDVPPEMLKFMSDEGNAMATLMYPAVYVLHKEGLTL